MTDFCISLSHVDKTFAKKKVLSDISLSVRKGEAFAFLGPNGAGKTTTMKCLLALIDIDSGSISVLGKSPKDIATKRSIGYAPEAAYLSKALTAREFLTFCGELCGMGKERITERIETTLKQVDLLSAIDTRMGKYSKWMLQRLTLAQAILHEPEIVFLDEPMSGLDPLGRVLVKNLIRGLQEKGTTIFFNTHILWDVAEICERFAIIHQGRIVADTMVKEVGAGNIETFFLEKVVS